VVDEVPAFSGNMHEDLTLEGPKDVAGRYKLNRDDLLDEKRKTTYEKKLPDPLPSPFASYD
jgi:hypothetical protein